MLPCCERVLSIPRSRYLPRQNRGIPVPKDPTTIGGHLRRKRLELGINQSEAARILKVSTVTLSRWECDKVYPTWAQQSQVTAYLGYAPFSDPKLGRPKGNETLDVASLSSEAALTVGQQILQYRLKQKKTRKQFAEELGVNVKTLYGWEMNRHQPSPLLVRNPEPFATSTYRMLIKRLG
jgi:transcriptional regulator with XRE-family HTH domain